MDALCRFGIASSSHHTSVETMKLLPGLFSEETRSKNTTLFPREQKTNNGFFNKKCRKDDDLLTPIVVTLYDQLDSKQREQQAFSALVRHQVLKNL